MPWKVEWSNGISSGTYETEWQAERYGCMENRINPKGGFRLVDLAPPTGLRRTMLEPHLSASHWVDVAEYLGGMCDRFWMHWWFRPSNDGRSLWDQLLNLDGSPLPEPLPPRDAFELKRLGPVVDLLEHSWICPNGAAATGRLTRDTLTLLLKREDVQWWDLHLYDGGRKRFVATDGGGEHFAWVFERDLESLVQRGIPSGLFRHR